MGGRPGSEFGPGIQERRGGAGRNRRGRCNFNLPRTFKYELRVDWEGVGGKNLLAREYEAALSHIGLSRPEHGQVETWGFYEAHSHCRLDT